ncbi:MAG TPA: hypothetical protein VF801_16580 [Rhodocyclaceae bacterium]
MRALRHHPLIALLCALCLLGAQQAAGAHFAGHLGAAARTTTVHHSAGDELPALDGICATCAAFAALSSAPPPHSIVLAAVRIPAVRPVPLAPVFTPAPAAPPYASRAPPAVP